METSLGKKPYKFVPLNNNTRRTRINAHNGKDSGNTFSGRFEVTIKALTPIHISQGSYIIDNGRLIRKFMRRNDKIVIPGSSIKGMLRSIFEAVTESCTPKLPNNFKPLEAALPGKHENVCTGTGNELCPACSVFGTTFKSFGYKCKLRISEFSLSSQEKDIIEIINLPDLKGPFSSYPEESSLRIFKDNYKKNPAARKQHGNERLYYADFYEDESRYDTLKKSKYFEEAQRLGEDRSIKFRGRKFYMHNLQFQEKASNYNGVSYEMVRSGAEFKGSINFENLTESELAALSLTLGIGEEYKYKIGYGKPAYFGSIELKIDKVTDYNSRYTGKTNISLDMLNTIKEKYKSTAPEDIKAAIDKLEEILTCKVTGDKWPIIEGNKSY